MVNVLDLKFILMKNIIVLIIFFGFISCTHSSKTPNSLSSSGTYHYTGVITSLYPIANATVCAGGYNLKITGNDTAFRFYPFPAGVSFDTTTFPINVKLNYLETGGSCGGTYLITVQSISLAE